MLIYWDDFLEVKSTEELIDKTNTQEFSKAKFLFAKRLKEIAKEEYNLELKSNQLTEVIKELKTHELTISDLLSDTEAIEFLLNEAYGIFQTEYNEHENVFIIKKGTLDFHPSLFKNIAFLYYETKEDLDQLLEDILGKKPLNYKKWKKFKDYFETMDLPEDLYSEIRTFIEEVLEIVEEEKNAWKYLLNFKNL